MQHDRREDTLRIVGTQCRLHVVELDSIVFTNKIILSSKDPGWAADGRSGAMQSTNRANPGQGHWCRI